MYPTTGWEKVWIKIIKIQVLFLGLKNWWNGRPCPWEEPPHIDNEYEIITRYEKTQWAFRLDLCDVSVFAWHTASKHQRCRNSHLTTNHCCQKFCDSHWISLKIGYSVTSKINPGQWSCLYHSKCHPNVGCVFIICTRWLSTWSIEMLNKKFAAGLMSGISSYPGSTYHGIIGRSRLDEATHSFMAIMQCLCYSYSFMKHFLQLWLWGLRLVSWFNGVQLCLKLKSGWIWRQPHIRMADWGLQNRWPNDFQLCE